MTSEGREVMSREPEQDAAMAICLTAWMDLETCRSIGMGGAGPIPWTAARDWCRDQGLDAIATRIVLAVLRKLDIDRAEREASKER